VKKRVGLGSSGSSFEGVSGRWPPPLEAAGLTASCLDRLPGHAPGWAILV